MSTEIPRKRTPSTSNGQVASNRVVSLVMDPCEVESARDFEMLRRQPQALVVDFWAPGCRPCREMTSAFKKMAAKYGVEATFAKVNVNEHPELAKEIKYLPTFLVYRQGRALGVIVGARTLTEFDAELSQLLARKREI